MSGVIRLAGVFVVASLAVSFLFMVGLAKIAGHSA